MKLKIGDYEIPERCLRFVILYPELSSVSFAGIFVGQKERDSGAALRRLSELRAIPFEAVDKNGIGSTGICDVKDLKLVGRGTSIVKFSGRLVRPFQD